MNKRYTKKQKTQIVLEILKVSRVRRAHLQNHLNGPPKIEFLVYNSLMPQYRRSLIEGGTYFFTVVTFNRLPILTGDQARGWLHSAWVEACRRSPFETVAVCLLPEHIHCIWSMPEGDAEYSRRWSEIKRFFTKGYLLNTGEGGERNESRLKRREAAVWQRRFWEHTIRDEEDLNRHLDYIHYNPVKHGLVKSAAEWPWSSFHRFVRMGYYAEGRGEGVEDKIGSMRCGE